MIIPIIDRSDKKIGDTVVLIDNVHTKNAIFTIGHKFILQKINKNGTVQLYETDIDDVFTINENKITLDVSYNEAISYNQKISNKRKIITFIKNNCMKSSISFEDYERYKSCKLKKRRDDECVPCFGCIKYIKKEKIDSNKFVKNYFRKIKINKIIKNES